MKNKHSTRKIRNTRKKVKYNKQIQKFAEDMDSPPSMLFRIFKSKEELLKLFPLKEVSNG